MYIVDDTYFIKKLSKPNVEEHGSPQRIELESSIDKYARQFLQETLGNVLFSDLNTNITDGVLDVGAPLKWLNLVNGCNYLLGDKTYTWKGLIYEEGTFKESILAYYVYLNDYQTTTNTMMGQVALDGKNGILADSTPHLIEIRNEFVEMYQGSYNCNPIQYYRNSTLFVDYFGNRESGYVSYLQFLTDNATDYPDITAGYLKFENRFGL